MSQQALDLNTPAPFHRNASDTEREAARKTYFVSGAKRVAVYEVIQNSGTRGVTDKEIAAALEWPINTVTPRRGELRAMGFVERVGKRDGSQVWAAK